ncbi:hypothetical protein HpHCM65_03910 [Helicobacter pylori]
MMTKNSYAFVVIEEKVMAFKRAKDKGLIPIFEGFAPLKEGFLKNFKESCNLEFLESLDLLFLYDKPSVGELRKAKQNKDDLRWVTSGLQFVTGVVSVVYPPARVAGALAVAAIGLASKFIEEDTKKCKRNVELLEQALEIYSIQARASRELVEGAWESVKKILGFYTHKHQEFIKHLNYVSEAIDNQYNIVPPEILNESDFESPTIVYNPKKSVFDERLKRFKGRF